MWNKFKNVYNKVTAIILAILLIIFLFYMIFTLLVVGVKGTDPITLISIVTAILSFPGAVNVLADEFNPKKKTYKLSCKCPKCKHLISMDMVEG